MGMDMVLKNSSIIAILIATISPSTLANVWQFDPTIRINETYTDNVDIEPSDKTSSFVNQLGVGATANYLSNNTALNVETEVLYTSYSHDSDLNDIFLTLASDVRINLGATGLALTGSASITNRPRNSSINPYADLISGDTTQFEQYSTGLSYNINNQKYILSSSLVYNTSRSEDNIGERNGYSANINSTNGTNSNNLYWDLSASYSDSENNGRSAISNSTELKFGYITPYQFTPFVRLFQEDNSGSVSSSRFSESDALGLGFRWLVIPRLVVDLSYNFPSEESSDTSQGNEQDDYYDANINWQPSQRTKLSTGLSQRFYGDSYDFSLSHKNRRLTNKISYDESIQAFTRDSFSAVNQGFFWCPNTGTTSFDVCEFSNVGLDLNEFSIRPIFDFQIIEDNIFSLNKRWSWLTSLALSRTTFTFTASRVERVNLIDETSDDDENKSKTDNVSFKISRKVSGYSTLDFSSSYSKTHSSISSPAELLSRHRRYNIDYNRDLNSTLSLTLGLSHQNSDSVPALFNYKENRISLEINKVL